MERMTADEVTAMRLPDRWVAWLAGGRWRVTTNKHPVDLTARELAIASVAQNCADGSLPPSALDAVWDAVEGRYPAQQTSEPRPLDTERRALWASYVVERGVDNTSQADRALAAFDARFGGGR